ncbi:MULTISPECIES: hypothetical protein [unclassified Streptomyces]|uniref:hypothetical protein n=1 Tax=unclassified Streptomyces TaxID=2593676 RepID=UPI000BACA8B1|nr:MULTISPECIES: hypothetical protein [unclassified Streptomyces]ASY37011.1 hypothetical protein CAC01_30710 [Streptomyces sp. CLI2509]MYX24193.1 hypothetical protein [Streptomyces sp. SID8380]
MAVAPEVRAAQRRVIGTIDASGRLNADELALWREVNCAESKATAAEISRTWTCSRSRLDEMERLAALAGTAS